MVSSTSTEREALVTSGQMYRQSTSEAGICSAAPLVRLLACCGLLACRLASLSCFVFGWNCTQRHQLSFLSSQQTQRYSSHILGTTTPCPAIQL